MVKVLLITGSFRNHSMSKMLIEKIQLWNAHLFDISILRYEKLPLFNFDILEKNSEIKTISNQIRESDIIWLISPEYNASYPGIVKNLFDWLSVMYCDDSGDSIRVLENKKYIITGIGGKSKGRFFIQEAERLFKKLKMTKLTNSTGISLEDVSEVADNFGSYIDSKVGIGFQVDILRGMLD